MRPLRMALLTAALVTHCAPPSAPNVPMLTIPKIGFSHAIVVGDQQQIDEGNVVNFDAAGGCWPGQGCTVWLAGHRTSHGGVFRQVPDLAVGDELSVRYDGSSYQYVVTGSQFVDRADPPPDFMQGDLMVQTSWTHGQVLLVYADQEAG
jgi:LPXTG-site transpeptidase (sortase) family protein